MPDTTTRLSPRFATPDAQAALEALALQFAADVRAWLQEHEPAYYAQFGDDRLLDSCFQACQAAESVRQRNAGADPGRHAAEAIAHQVAALLLAQPDPQAAYADFGRIVVVKAQEMAADTYAAPTEGQA